MTISFDISELVRVAISDEQSGVQFYQNLSIKAADQTLKGKFSWLSDQEKKHQDRFQTLLNDIQERNTLFQYPDNYLDYLEQIVSQDAFGKEFKDVSEKTDDEALLKMAMEFEQHQLSLQKDIADVIGEDYNDIVNEVLQEERGHLLALSKMKEDLTAGK